MTFKTEEAKLREEIEQIEKTPDKHIKPCHECENLPLLKAKLQQLLADKKMFKDAIEKCKMEEIVIGPLTGRKVIGYKELLKTLGLQEED